MFEALAGLGGRFRAFRVFGAVSPLPRRVKCEEKDGTDLCTGRGCGGAVCQGRGAPPGTPAGHTQGRQGGRDSITAKRSVMQWTNPPETTHVCGTGHGEPPRVEIGGVTSPKRRHSRGAEADGQQNACHKAAGPGIHGDLRTFGTRWSVKGRHTQQTARMAVEVTGITSRNGSKIGQNGLQSKRQKKKKAA